MKSSKVGADVTSADVTLIRKTCLVRWSFYIIARLAHQQSGISLFYLKIIYTEVKSSLFFSAKPTTLYYNQNNSKIKVISNNASLNCSRDTTPRKQLHVTLKGLLHCFSTCTEITGNNCY